MKKISLVIIALILCFSMISCNEAAEQPESDSVSTDVPIMSMPPETLQETEVLTHILVDWTDFVRVGGKVYYGGFENREIDVSRVGEKLGEILYTVRSYYESQEALNQADKRDFTAAFRPIGCEIFAVKDDEKSITVLDDGKYYLYTRNDD